MDITLKIIVDEAIRLIEESIEIADSDLNDEIKLKLLLSAHFYDQIESRVKDIGFPFRWIYNSYRGSCSNLQAYHNLLEGLHNDLIAIKAVIEQ